MCDVCKRTGIVSEELHRRNALIAELAEALKKIADATVMGHEYSVSACVYIIASETLRKVEGK